MNKTWLGAICLSIAASIWGGMYVVSKYVLEYVPPITLVWIRYVIGFAVLFLLLKISERRGKKQERKKLTNREWMLLVWIGFIGYFVSVSFQFVGTKLSNAHTGSLITSATPAFIVIFARAILKEKVTLQKTISLLLATMGVVIVVGWNNDLGNLAGNLILVGAAVTWALLSVYVKVSSKTLSSLVITTYAILFAILFTTPFMVREVMTNTVTFENSLVLLGILYLGVVSTAGAFFLWNKGMELMDAGIGSLFFFFQPLVGSFLGWLLLNEHMDSNFFIGGICIVIGVVIEIYKKRDYKNKMV